MAGIDVLTALAISVLMALGFCIGKELYTQIRKLTIQVLS